MWSTLLLYLNYVLFVISGIIEEQANLRQIPVSQQKINEIRYKIDKIAHNLLTHSSSDNRNYILRHLEKKLLKETEHLGQRDKKQVKLIMEGIKLKVLNGTEFSTNTEFNKNIQTTTEENARSTTDNNNEYLIKPPYINHLSNKFKSLIDFELQKFTATEHKRNLLNLMKMRLLEAFDRKQTEILRNIKNTNDTRRKHDDDFINSLNSSTNIHNNENQVKFNQNFTHSLHTHNTLNKYKKPIVSPSCDKLYRRICNDINSINKLKCRYELGYITLDKLCDGVSDCPFKSDENQCYSQVKEKAHYAEQVMADIEAQKYKCNDVSNFVLSKQSQILRNALDHRLNPGVKYKDANSTLHGGNVGSNRLFNDKINSKRMINEIALIISSLALTLDGTLCSNKIDIDSRRNAVIFEMDLDKEFKETLSHPKSCKCENEFCYKCTYYCKRLCRQKFSLTNWNCESVSRTMAVSLNLLCDGKLDCFDESDERGCVTGSGYAKFEASEIYNNILKMLEMKASKERQPVHKNLLYLSSLISELQNLTLKSVPKLKVIKRIRDKCYSMLRKIYFDMITQSYIDSNTEEAYPFLLSINQNLGKALKLSHTGNTKVIDRICHCRNGTCSASDCSKVCVRACVVEPKLTKYYCKGHSKKSVTISKICDGKQDCDDGYDELNCKKDEICRRHHLVILRHKLQDIGVNFKGTALGELLSSWKAQVVSTLKVVEENERPTPKVLRKVIEDIVKDLVVTYGYIVNYRRRNTDYALVEFTNISQTILESIKTCRK